LIAEAKLMYNKIFEFKFLPPGRGLWAMGSPITEKKMLYAALNNCAFISTKSSDIDSFIKTFVFLMDSAMLGVGVGFDTKGSESQFIIKGVKQDNVECVAIDDSREGWVNSVKVLLESFFKNKSRVIFDYSKIRPKGIKLSTFGGISSGPDCLRDIHVTLSEVLEKNTGGLVNSRLIVDMMNIIGRGVVAGNIRRSAEIALGEENDEEFLNLKNYKINPDRASWGWLSNNSVYAKIGQNYDKIVESIRLNGEPGLLWLDNMQKFSRMNEIADYKDIKATGGNPCLEQTLESYEMCCLSETFPNNHKDLDEFLDTLKLAFKYAKIVTLGTTHWKETNTVMQRNRR
jgi:ribonucleotide reductase alpha subunit